MILVAVGIVTVVLGVLGLLIYQGRSEYRSTSQTLASVNALPLRVAEEQALALLQNPDKFANIKAEGANERALAVFPSALRRFFSQYARVESKSAAGAYVDQKVIAPSALRPEYTVIGHGMQHTDLAYELAVLPDDERIYELDAAERPDPAVGTYATIFHWVIACANEKASR